MALLVVVALDKLDNLEMGIILAGERRAGIVRAVFNSF
jgi:hypothetical protein